MNNKYNHFVWFFCLLTGCQSDDAALFGEGGAPAGGNGGAGGETGIAGQGGTAGTAGAGGIAGSDAGGADAGAGGTAGSGGIAGNGGNGGAGGALPLVCTPGAADNPASWSINGGTKASVYLRYADGTEGYSTANPSNINFPLDFPGQLVGSTADGMTINLIYNSGSAPGNDFYQVTTDNVPECAGTNFYSQACDQKVAQDFRCLYFPAEEADCGNVKAAFLSLGKQKSYSAAFAGNRKVLVSVRCSSP